MNFLVLGSDGQLGHAIAENRLFSVHNVFLFDKDRLDITDENALLSFFSSNKIDAVINCAAFTNVDLCEKKKAEAELINVQGTKNIAKAALKFDSVMVHISTDFVFDGNKNTPYLEDEPTAPLNYYGLTKLRSEEIVRETVPKYFIVRTSSMYSRYGNNFVKAIIRRAIETGSVRVVDDQTSCPTNSNDLAEAIYYLLMTEKYGTYHVSNSGYCSKYEFAEYIIDCCELHSKVIPCKSSDYPDSAERPRFSAFDCRKYSEATREDLINWRDSLKKFLRENKDLYERK